MALFSFLPFFQFSFFHYSIFYLFCFSSLYQGVVLLDLLETKINPNCLIFSQRERERDRESPKSSREGCGRMVQCCWVNFPTNLNVPIALSVGTRGGCLDILVSCIFSHFFLPLWETARYRLKYCLKGPLNPKKNNHPNPVVSGMRTPVYSCYHVEFRTKIRVEV